MILRYVIKLEDIVYYCIFIIYYSFGWVVKIYVLWMIVVVFVYCIGW